MFNLSQTKTAQGFIPFKDVKTVEPTKGNPPATRSCSLIYTDPSNLASLTITPRPSTTSAMRT